VRSCRKLLGKEGKEQIEDKLTEETCKNLLSLLKLYQVVKL
jgi:hypothetical protein